MKNFITTSIISTLLSATLYAQDSSDIALTAKFGTLGFGVDTTLGLSEDVNLRLNLNKGKVTVDDVDNKKYISDGGVDLFTAGVIADYHPYHNGFRASAGLYYNANKIDVTDNIPQDNVLIGKKRYDFTKDTKTHLEVTPNQLAPYLGIGWGNAISKGSPWNISVDVGVLYQGKPDVTLSMSGTARDHDTGKNVNLDTNNIFKNNVAKEKSKIQSDTDGLAFYPVLTLGVSYRF